MGTPRLIHGEHQTRCKGRYRHAVILIMGSAVFGGCSVTPEKLALDALVERVQQDQAQIQRDDDHHKDGLSLPQALSRTVSLNLDSRTRRLERLIADHELDLSSRAAWPDLTLEAGYSGRDREGGSGSINTQTGALSASRGVGNDAHLRTGSLKLSWNVLDMGLAHLDTLAAEQQGEIMMRNEQRAQLNLMADVVVVYHQAYAAQAYDRAASGLDEKIQQALVALDDSAMVGGQNKQNLLNTQRRLLRLKERLQARRVSLAGSRSNLMALVNLPPGLQVPLLDPGFYFEPTPIEVTGEPMARLEHAALGASSLFHEAEHLIEVTRLRARRALTSLLPSPGLSLDHQYTSNSFERFDDFVGLGTSVTFDLMDARRYFILKDSGDQRLALEEARRNAVAMGELTKLHIALARYNGLVNEYGYARALNTVRSRYADTIGSQRAAGVMTHVAQFEAELQALEAGINQRFAHAELIEALLRLYHSAGIDVTAEVRDRLNADEPYALQGDFQAALQQLEHPAGLIAAHMNQQPQIVADELDLELPNPAMAEVTAEMLMPDQPVSVFGDTPDSEGEEVIDEIVIRQPRVLPRLRFDHLDQPPR